jgi:hypothetical protein
MAPRAEFEVDRKFLSELLVQTPSVSNTPQAYPMHRLAGRVCARSRETPAGDCGEGRCTGRKLGRAEFHGLVIRLL